MNNKNKFLILFLVCTTFLSTNVSAQAKLSTVLNKVKPSVVYIETTQGSGSGIITTANGRIITNAHVVSGVKQVKVTTTNKKTYSGNVLFRDEVQDIAIIQIAATKLTPIVQGNSSLLKQGDTVYALGFPLGIKGDVSVSSGIVSRFIDGQIETTANIHPGNSGGALINTKGELVGINTSALGNQINGIMVGESLKYAIPVNTMKTTVLNLLMKGDKLLTDSSIYRLKEERNYYYELLDSIEEINDLGSEAITNSADAFSQATRGSLFSAQSNAQACIDKLDKSFVKLDSIQNSGLTDTTVKNNMNLYIKALDKQWSELYVSCALNLKGINADISRDSVARNFYYSKMSETLKQFEVYQRETSAARTVLTSSFSSYLNKQLAK